MNRSSGGPEGEKSPGVKQAGQAPQGERFVSLGERSIRRPFFMGSMLSLTAVAVGAGLSLSGHLKLPGLERLGLGRVASAADARPPAPLKPQPDAGSGASTGERAPGAPAPPPPPDPRIVRALDTRVHLQAGRASLWTELRRLGVGLAWPDGSEPKWTVDDRRFDRAIHRFARRVEHLPRNARLIHSGGSLHTVPARSGRLLDRSQLRQQLLTALAAPEFRRSLEAATPAKLPPISLTPVLREVPPKITADHLGSINTLLAAYSTSMGGSSRNRRHNIQVACQAIDGTVLTPGEVFSYNDTVGPRSERAGFRTAPVIIRGELVAGTGGGVCQVSSTLYNVALLGGLKIVRRSHHQFPVHYVPPGRDATVAYGSLDLRFANSLPHPVALDVKAVGSRVVVHLYGCPDCKRDVRLVSSRGKLNTAPCAGRRRPSPPRQAGDGEPDRAPAGRLRAPRGHLTRQLRAGAALVSLALDVAPPGPAAALARSSRGVS